MAQLASLNVDELLIDFVNKNLLQQLPVSAEQFWSGLAKIVNEYGPRNRALIAKRETLQKQIDDWHVEHKNQPIDQGAYQDFLRGIGYLVKEPAAFEISTQNVDPEIALIAGPQLVVPVSNARYALNAANARWGSLYDGLYGTDAISDDDGAQPNGAYNPKRGAKVIAWAKNFLDQAIPLEKGSHKDATAYVIENEHCVVTMSDGTQTQLFACIGYNGDANLPDAIICKHNGLHVELKFNRSSPVGQQDESGMSDVVLESALSTIMDCEDSVAAVDAQDKVGVYSNWLGLMKGDLSVDVTKGAKTIKRALSPDRIYTGLDEKPFSLKGRALMFSRNVGLLMTSPMVLDKNGNQVPECILDTYINACSALHDLNGERSNSAAGSVYFVVPKMHGPDEVAFANDLFGAVETVLKMPPLTLKMGIMDEERRTSANLAACIHAARERVCFINTGFLDRTGDEIHTSMQAGPMLAKGEMKNTKWISAYEDRNVDIGLACGFSGHAQIGKGMWAMPDLMADMLAQKQAHLQAGANTAWVPSPTAATLHATHYHQINVFEVQEKLKNRPLASLDDLLTIPLAGGINWSADEIRNEIENNSQSILGYVVRWIEQGIGCSKVPDIHNIGLMEDRATLRISSQLMANWLLHGVINQQQIIDTMKQMAKVVDEQNAGDKAYVPMTPDTDKSIAFQAAVELVLKGATQPSGYTEPILHARRAEAKRANLQ